MPAILDFQPATEHCLQDVKISKVSGDGIARSSWHLEQGFLMFFQSLAIELLYLAINLYDLFDFSKFSIVICNNLLYLERTLSQILPRKMFWHIPIEEFLTHEPKVKVLG